MRFIMPPVLMLVAFMSVASSPTGGAVRRQRSSHDARHGWGWVVICYRAGHRARGVRLMAPPVTRPRQGERGNFAVCLGLPRGGSCLRLGADPMSSRTQALLRESNPTRSEQLRRSSAVRNVGV